jgi:multiple sugar transport system substrate-binding protein
MKFQYILVSFFGVMAVVSVIVFANAPSKSEDPALAGVSGKVNVWGTYPVGGVNEVLQKLNDKYRESFSVEYQYHDPANFDRDIVEALASGRGPDVLLLPDNLILRHTDKIEQIPYTSIPQLTFKSMFIQAAEIYMRQNGVVAVPYAIDPMVMYWNRDLFDNASITVVPTFWDEFLTLAPKLTTRDQKTQDITQSAIAFGEYANVANAKDILAMLFLQTGDPIVRMNSQWYPVGDLLKQDGEYLIPDQDVISALRYYMDFSNPLKSIYSWSRALPNSRDQFLKGGLAVYFGYASEYKVLKEKNPHLNFAVAPVPQTRGTTVEITFAKMHGLAVLKSSTNKATAFVAVQKLLESDYSGAFASQFGLPPVRRDLLNVQQTDAVMSVLYDSAIRARTWLDPRPEATEGFFKTAIESISSGRNDVTQSVSVLGASVNSELLPYQY